MKVGDIVRPRGDLRRLDPEEHKYGIVLDAYEDDYGIVYYEIHWNRVIEWWSENELERL